MKILTAPKKKCCLRCGLFIIFSFFLPVYANPLSTEIFLIVIDRYRWAVELFFVVFFFCLQTDTAQDCLSSTKYFVVLTLVTEETHFRIFLLKKKKKTPALKAGLRCEFHTTMILVKRMRNNISLRNLPCKKLVVETLYFF